MIDLLADGVTPFSAAIVLMIFIGILEAASVIGGFSIGAMVDSIIPDIDADFELEHPGHMGPMAHLFSWLSIGRVPSLVLLVLFLFSFGVSGWTIQLAWSQIFGSMMSAGIAFIPASILGIFGMSRLGALVARIIPKDETNVASRKDLLGGVATVTRASGAGYPAEAKGFDLSGRTHYFLIEEDQALELEDGDKILVLRLKDNEPIYQGQKISSTDI